MKIVQKKCPSCGAKLELTPGEMEGTCNYCNNDFIIDDDVIEVKVEVKDDYDYEIAVTTLENFKDYSKALNMFRDLVSRYGHKKDIYLYSLRALTHEFKRKDLSVYDILELNSTWDKYKSLASSKEVEVYEQKIKSLNAHYWLSELLKKTDEFDKKTVGKVNLKRLNGIWDNYVKYASENSYNKYKTIYETYYNLAEQKNKNKKIFWCVAIFIALVSIASIVLFFLTEKPKLKNDKINYSLLLNYKNKVLTEESFLNQVFENGYNIKVISTDYYNDKLYLDFEFSNVLKSEKYSFTLYLLDDRGPVIRSNKCEFTDTDKVDLYTCVKVNDLTDEVKNNMISFDTSACDFKKIGTCDVTVKAVDLEENESTEVITVTIKKSTLNVDVKIKKSNLIEGDKTKLSYSIKPNVSNKNVKIEYNSDIISIDKDLNVTALKRGTTDVCVIPEYDSNARSCLTVNVKLKCKDSYTFKFDGSKEERIVAGIDMCSGTYKVYASVLNKKDAYHLTYNPATGYNASYYTIWKSAGSLSDEGSKISFEEGSYLEVPIGVTKITLK